MRYIPVIKADTGMVLGQDIYDGEGKVLLGKGLMLDGDAIQGLLNLGLPGVYVEDGFGKALHVPGLASQELKREALRLVHDLFQEGSGDVEQDGIQEVARKITREALDARNAMYNRIDIRSSDEYTFFHSVNVAVLSAMLGIETGNLGLEELNTLTTAALLHDVGKRYVEADVLNAKRTLTEEERLLIVQHPKLSYDFLKENYDFIPELCTGVLEHHEWYNGCGYPLRRSGDDISYYARIIKVADVFDALTSKLPYHDPISPSAAVDYILGNAGVEFDPDLAELFAKKIAIYPVGCEVALSDGRNALVVENAPESVLRPKVKVLPDGDVVDLKSEEAKELAILELFM